MKLPSDVIIHLEENKSGTGIEEMVLEELIHCRDCRHRTHNGTCIRTMKKKADDGYCDEGEQKHD